MIEPSFLRASDPLSQGLSSLSPNYKPIPFFDPEILASDDQTFLQLRGLQTKTE